MVLRQLLINQQTPMLRPNLPGNGGGGGVSRTQMCYPPTATNLYEMAPKWRIAPCYILHVTPAKHITLNSYIHCYGAENDTLKWHFE